MKIARSLLGTRIRGARLFLRDLSGLEDTSRRIAVGNETVKITSVPPSPSRPTPSNYAGATDSDLTPTARWRGGLVPNLPYSIFGSLHFLTEALAELLR